jgi:hypothetical protein
MKRRALAPARMAGGALAACQPDTKAPATPAGGLSIAPLKYGFSLGSIQPTFVLMLATIPASPKAWSNGRQKPALC